MSTALHPDAATRVRQSVERLRQAGGARTSLRLTPAAVAALEVLKARHPEAGQNDLICQAIEEAARRGVGEFRGVLVGGVGESGGCRGI